MNKKKIGEKTDSLLEAEMIKEAKMIEESLLGNAANDFEISAVFKENGSRRQTG